jgi:hypothetical protein
MFGMQTSPPRARLTKGENSSNNTPEINSRKRAHKEAIVPPLTI